MDRYNEVEVFIRSYLAPRFARGGISDPADDLSLIDSGVIDSFGLLELLSAAEAKFSVKVDLEEVDMDVVTTYGGFIRAIAGA